MTPPGKDQPAIDHVVDRPEVAISQILNDRVATIRIAIEPSVQGSEKTTPKVMTNDSRRDPKIPVNMKPLIPNPLDIGIPDVTVSMIHTEDLDTMSTDMDLHSSIMSPTIIVSTTETVLYVIVNKPKMRHTVTRH